jgi:hypothetical protein
MTALELLDFCSDKLLFLLASRNLLSLSGRQIRTGSVNRMTALNMHIRFSETRLCAKIMFLLL